MDGNIGEIRMFAGNFAPRNWAFCDGQLLSIAQNTALFSILGTTFGGNGQTTFALPDFRGRGPIHAGQGPGLSNHTLGENGGAETTTLTVNQIPAHNHALQANTGAGTTAVPASNTALAGVQDATANPISSFIVSAPNVQLHPSSITNAGGSQPHSNFPPYLTVNFVICLFGVFPSRN